MTISFPCGLVLAWTQALRLALLDEESLRKVDPLFQLAHPLFQLIEFAKAGLNIVQRLALLGRVHYTGRQFGPLTRTQALRPKSKENSEQSVSGDVPGLTFTRGEPNAPDVDEGQDPRNWNPGSMPEPHIDRKSTRLNSSHSQISYAVFCLKKKKKKKQRWKACTLTISSTHSMLIFMQC